MAEGMAASDEHMLQLARALLMEACGRTGPRLQLARALGNGLPEEEELRAATADARRLLASCAAASSSAAARRERTDGSVGEEDAPVSEPPCALELLKVLASLETAAQQLLVAAAAKEAEGGEEGEEGAGGGALPLHPAPTSAAAASAASAAASGPGGDGRRQRPRRSAVQVLRGLLWDEDLDTDAAPSPIVVDDLLLERWFSNDSELWQGDAAMLRRLAEDASLLMQATAAMNNLVKEAGETIDAIEEDTRGVKENTDRGIEVLAQTTKTKHKIWPFKSTLACTVGGTATGLIVGCSALPAVAIGAGVGAVGGGVVHEVRRQYRRRVDKLVRARAASAS